MYCAVTGLFNTVLFPLITGMESLVQVTVVAGPPEEIQVRVSCEVHPTISGKLSIIIVIVRLPTIKLASYNGWGLELQAVLTFSIEIESNIRCVSSCISTIVNCSC